MKATKRTITAEEEAAIDALYASPPSEFTKKRNAIAKAFAASGRREAAKAVLARKKPSSSAFVLNQLARTHAKAVSALVVVGRELERAQRGALQKEGGTQLREAVARQREIIRDLSQKAGVILRTGGGPKSANLEAVVRALHAALVDAAVGEALERGQLERAPVPAVGGFASVAAGDVVVPARHPARDAAERRPARVERERDDARVERERDDARVERERDDARVEREKKREAETARAEAENAEANAERLAEAAKAVAESARTAAAAAGAAKAAAERARTRATHLAKQIKRVRARP